MYCSSVSIFRNDKTSSSTVCMNMKEILTCEQEGLSNIPQFLLTTKENKMDNINFWELPRLLQVYIVSMAVMMFTVVILSFVQILFFATATEVLTNML